MKLFELDRITMTPSAITIIANNKIAVGSLLERHQSGDYGEITHDDWRQNTLALLPESLERIMSLYHAGEEKLWIVTDPDRSLTTLLTEEDF